MGSYRVAGNTSDFPEGTPKKVVVDQQEIMLTQVGGNFYAVANRCPHMKGDLSKGKLEGTVISCPRHGSQFDITDGKVVRWLKGSGMMSAIGKTLKSEKSLQTYPVKVEGDTVLVEV
jgi:3-phenylpropionate/trans-cinnamate dioxygenase ferredoxin subunit